MREGYLFPEILAAETARLAVIGTLSLASEQHPNKLGFKGVLVRLDEPSTKPPNGAQGHLILVPSDVARRRLPTLVGMGVNYAADLKGHAQQRKVGVIEKAWIEGQDLWVSGHVWKHDFPDAENDLKQKGLGMSMEIGDVHVEDPQADIWKLTDFTFLGGTILWQNAAAYNRTQAIAASAAKKKSKENAMEKTVEKKAAETPDLERIASIAATAASKAVLGSIKGVLKEQNEVLKAQTNTLAELSARIETLELNGTAEVIDAGKADDEEEDDEEAAALAAKKAEDEEEEDDEEAAGVAADHMDDGDGCKDDEEEDGMESVSSDVNKGSLTDMGPDSPDDDEGSDPGHINKGSKNKGGKTSTEDGLGKNVNKAVTGAAISVLRRQVKRLGVEKAELQAELAKLKKRVGRMSKQVTASAEETNRRSISAEIFGLLKKNGIDPNEMRANGETFDVEQVDAIIKGSVPNLSPTDRMALKNAFLQAGLMKDGQVNRGNNGLAVLSGR